MEYTSMPNPTVQYPRTGVVRKLLNDKIISAKHCDAHNLRALLFVHTNVLSNNNTTLSKAVMALDAITAFEI